MPDLNEQNPTVWLKAKDWIVGLTAVLVVLPALINAGIDVYKAALNIPKTDAEQVNIELFKKYFNKPPVAAFRVPIKYSLGTAEAKFSIYEEGDVFVEYGSSSQWLLHFQNRLQKELRTFLSFPKRSLNKLTPHAASVRIGRQTVSTDRLFCP